MIYARINGTGSYLPKKSLSNKELEANLDTSDEWIRSRTGIHSRCIADASETTTSMAINAAQKAIESSSISADDIDMILLATCTPERFFPSTACSIQKALGISKPIPAMDLSAACSGFVYAMDVAYQYIRNGTAKHVLIVGSDTMSRTLDWSDRGTCILFGDGAGAAVLSASDKQGIIASKLHADLDEDGLLRYDNGSLYNKKTTVQMRGSEVFKLAVNVMGNIVDEILQQAQLNQADIDWLVPHQANIRIIQAIAKKLNMSMERVIVTIAKQGNTSAASIPLALDYSIREGKIQRGDLMLMESFGGGMTWGAMLIRY